MLFGNSNKLNLLNKKSGRLSNKPRTVRMPFAIGFALIQVTTRSRSFSREKMTLQRRNARNISKKTRKTMLITVTIITNATWPFQPTSNDLNITNSHPMFIKMASRRRFPSKRRPWELKDTRMASILRKCFNSNNRCKVLLLRRTREDVRRPSR